MGRRTEDWLVIRGIYFGVVPPERCIPEAGATRRESGWTATLSGAQDKQRTIHGIATAAAVVIVGLQRFCRRRRANGGRTRENEGPNGCRGASFECEKMRNPVSGTAAARNLICVDLWCVFVRSLLPSPSRCAWMVLVLEGFDAQSSNRGSLFHAMGFILAVAFHSPAKLLITADAPAVASSVGIGLNAKK